ncbi:MAG: VWA containing CoxE family protein, partial [Alphaproteobacteria bacterium HGW-Alphaproteobacteria-12]
MSEVLGDFIRALRAADIRVSTSESIDAGNVVNLIGFDDRRTLRNALAQVLAKSEDEKQAFGETFDTYFSFEQFKARPANADKDAANENGARSGDEGEGENGEDGAPQSGGMPAPGGGGMGGERQGEESQGEPAPADLASLLERGDQAELQMALAEGARQAQLNRIRLFTQRGMFTRRIMEIMGLDGLNEEIERREASGDAAGTESLALAREALRGQVRDYVEKQLEIFTANAGRQLREEVLAQIRLSNIDRSDMKIMRELVRKMAKRLIALHSRRKKVARRGVLDIRRTIRANIEFDGLLFHTVWKRTKVDRPKVMAVCDVSG